VNTNGTPLIDLMSYRVFWGCDGSGYPFSNTIPAPASQHTVAGLPDAGTCRFVVAALNAAGEAGPVSNEATKQFVAQVPSDPTLGPTIVWSDEAVAVAVDAITQGANKVNSSSNDTIAHTSGGSANYGVVVIGFDDVTLGERSADSVTWGGSAMASVQDHDEGRSSTEIWVLANPPTGAQNIVIDPGSTGTTNFQGWAISLTGVDTGNPIVDVDGIEEASPSDLILASEADGLVIDIIHPRSATALDADASQGNEQLSGTVYGISTKAGTGSNVTMTWTFTSASGNISHSGISLRASSASEDIAANGALSVVGSAALKATGTLSSAGTASISGAADLDARGVLAAAGTASIVGAADLDAVGSVAAAGALSIAGAADLDSTGTLASAGALSVTGAAHLDAVGNLSAAGTASISGDASLTDADSVDIEADGALSITGAAGLSAVGSLAGAGTASISGLADLDASATLIANGTLLVAGTATLNATAQMTVAGQMQILGAALLVDANAQPALPVIGAIASLASFAMESSLSSSSMRATNLRSGSLRASLN
jgi:hypothetical protein